MDVRAFSCVKMPSMAILTVCCSITSHIVSRSLSFILSNSSMQQMPIFASTNAPGSSWNSFVYLSLTTDGDRSIPLDPLPVVYTDYGQIFFMDFRILDFSIPGSPINRILRSPCSLTPSFIFMEIPPIICNMIAFLTSTIF